MRGSRRHPRSECSGSRHQPNGLGRPPTLEFELTEHLRRDDAVVEGLGAARSDLHVLVPLARDQDDVPGPRAFERPDDGAAPVGLDDPVSARVLEACADMAGWNGPARREGRYAGVALVHSFGVPVAEIVEIEPTDRGIRLHNVWVVADPGTVVDPANIENQIQGGVVWGLGHAINSEITYRDGMAEQTNYHAAEGMRLYQCPNIHVRTLQDNTAVRGIGEPPVPPAAPALGNAIFAATGQRLREMPFNRAARFL